ncbi:MAG: CoA binding protein [Burkholderiaceae bacterium]|jgi:predicted CoA-binding protein|nr:MAG: CoA binding protein [Burkholderiaceae bacterium]
MNESDTITQILQTCRTVAVVGLSPKPHRDSWRIARYMQQQGWRIVPVNPNATEVLGERAYANLTEAAREQTIDLVDVFRHSDQVPALVDEAIAIGARAIWLQLGIAHDAALARAAAAGLLAVQDRCLMVEHARHSA